MLRNKFARNFNARISSYLLKLYETRDALNKNNLGFGVKTDVGPTFYFFSSKFRQKHFLRQKHFYMPHIRQYIFDGKNIFTTDTFCLRQNNFGLI